MVLLGRIELPTSSLPMTRSTTELQQQYRRCGPMRRLGLLVKRLASLRAIWHLPASTPQASGDQLWQKTQTTRSGSKQSGCARRCAQICVGASQSRMGAVMTSLWICLWKMTWLPIGNLEYSISSRQQGKKRPAGKAGLKRKRTFVFRQQSPRVASVICKK